MSEPETPLLARIIRLESALRASEAALAEAKAHVRDHHLEACESCIATESERNASEAALAEKDGQVEMLKHLLSEARTDRDTAIGWYKAARAEATKAETCDLCADGNLPAPGPTGYLWHMYGDGEHEPCKARHVCVTRTSSTCVWLADGTKVEAKRDPSATGKMWLEVKPQATIVPAAIRAPRPPYGRDPSHDPDICACIVPSSPTPPSEEPR